MRSSKILKAPGLSRCLIAAGLAGRIPRTIAMTVSKEMETCRIKATGFLLS
jgi:hypothetical protein